MQYNLAMTAARTKTFDELYQEIRDLPEGSRGEILEPGELHITMGRPGKPHRRAAQRIYRGLSGVDHDTGGTGWWIELEPEVRFGERMYDPDIAGWRVERVPDPENRLVQVFAPVDGRPSLLATAADEETLRLSPFDLDVHPRTWWIAP